MSNEFDDMGEVVAESPSMFVSAFDASEQFAVGEVRQYKPGDKSASLAELPYYDLIPKDLIGQLKWRLYVRRRCLVDKEFREAINAACRADILFFVNTFCYVEEPRPFPRELPLNSWPDQDEALAAMDECFGKRDFGAEKSRGVGFSYNIIVVTLRAIVFLARCKIGLVSRDEDSVDCKGDSDTLMAKLDFNWEWLPQHLRCMDDGHGPTRLDRTYSHHRFRLVDTEASAFGYSATGNVMTGGRKTAVFMDEFGKFKRGEDGDALASTQHVSDSRFFISTYKGNNNEFYKLMNTPSAMLKFVADWKDNPERSRGLYTSEDGELVYLDKSYQHPPDYEFITDGKIRSPWYDREWRKPGATPQSIAEELDRNPRGSVTKVICDEAFAAQQQYIKDPTFLGDVLHDRDAIPDRFVEKSNGKLRLWMPVSNNGKPGFPGPFIVAVDISAGAGQSSSSNSAIQIIDSRRCEQIGEWISNRVRPTQLATQAVAIARWLNDRRSDNNTVIIFENNYQGTIFDKELKRVNYGNVYKQKNSVNTKTKVRGYRKVDDGTEIFGNLEAFMLDRHVKLHSQLLINELDQYELRNGVIKHVASADGDDESAKGKPHGDCAVAFGIGCLLLSMKLVSPREPEPEQPPPGSVGAQILALQQSQGDVGSPYWGDMPSDPNSWN